MCKNVHEDIISGFEYLILWVAVTYTKFEAFIYVVLVFSFQLLFSLKHLHHSKKTFFDVLTIKKKKKKANPLVIVVFRKTFCIYQKLECNTKRLSVILSFFNKFIYKKYRDKLFWETRQKFLPKSSTQ